MADILITPGSSIMSFTSSLNYRQSLTQEASGSLTLLGSGSTGRTDIFTIAGNNGTLFSVSDDLSDSLFSVNTIAGLPVIEAFANNTVTLGTYGTPAITVNGTTAILTGSLFGTASWATNVVNNGVTSVGGTGTVNGISLSGTVTSTGNLTLGGTLSGIGNSQLTNSAITIAGTSTSLGGSISQATILAGSGVFSGSAQIPNSSISNAQLANSTISGISLGSTLAALTAGSYLTSAGTYTGNTARTFAVDATSANTVSKVVARDASGDFAAGIISADGMVVGTSFVNSGKTKIQIASTSANNKLGFSGGANFITEENLYVWNFTTGASAGISFQSNGTVNATTFAGALSGNASTATSAATWTTGRTLTIGNTGKSVNGSGNVSWTLSEIGAYAATNPSGYTTNTGTVTSITAGTGLSGGTITTSGTIALANTAVTAGSYTSANITVDAQGRITSAANGSGGGGITGSGTTNYLAKFTGTTAVGNSNITDDGSVITSTVEHTFNSHINTDSVAFGVKNARSAWGGDFDMSNDYVDYFLEGGVTSNTNYNNIVNTWADNRLVNGQILTTCESGEALTAGQLVRLRDDNTWYLADANFSDGSTKLLGIVLRTAPSAGRPISVLLDGIVAMEFHDDLASTSPGFPLYISTNAGNVTETAPTTAGEFVRLVGHNIYEPGLGQVVIRFQPDNTWLEL